MKLPESIRTYLCDKFPRESCAIELVTASEDDGPHLAHLSVGEVVLGDDHLIRLALWRGSRSCIALKATPKAALFFADVDLLLEVRCLALSCAPIAAAKPLTGFLLKPTEVRDKRVPYAKVLSGFRFALTVPAETHAHWGEARSALIQAFPTQARIGVCK